MQKGVWGLKILGDIISV